jgi:uncharacterized Fe-S center protein
MKNEAAFMKSEEALLAYLRTRVESVFAPYDRVAVKLHMGEPGNKSFIFDSPVVYAGPRNKVESYLRAAAEHGYTKEAIGAPVIISNRSTPLAGSRMTYHATSEPLEADGVLLLTHVKGHLACGMGGSIKNVGMGCMAKETKGAIHNGGEPVYTEGCTQCGACVESCPTDNIVIEGDSPRFGCTWCPGCSNCAIACPAHCIMPRVGTFDELLSEGAVLAHARFKKRYSVNVLRNISRMCDCVADSGPIILDDVGFVCAEDMVSADLASLEMIRSVSGRDDLFADHTKHSSWEHVRAAARHMGREAAVSIKRIE